MLDFTRTKFQAIRPLVFSVIVMLGDSSIASDTEDAFSSYNDLQMTCPNARNGESTHWRYDGKNLYMDGSEIEIGENGAKKNGNKNQFIYKLPIGGALFLDVFVDFENSKQAHTMLGDRSEGFCY